MVGNQLLPSDFLTGSKTKVGKSCLEAWSDYATYCIGAITAGNATEKSYRKDELSFGKEGKESLDTFWEKPLYITGISIVQQQQRKSLVEKKLFIVYRRVLRSKMELHEVTKGYF